MAWSGFERFRLSPIGAHEPPSFVGGPGPERLQTYVPLTAIDLGGGNDLVNLDLDHELVNHAVYAGGTGDDDFILNAGPGDSARRVRLDLPRSRLLFQRERQAVRARIDGFERHRLSANDLVFRGTSAADHVQWQGCHGVIDGDRGDDLIEEFSTPDVGCGYPVNYADLVVRGEGGDDRLLGSGAPNVLIGGSGRDLADGRGSDRDHCVAEREIRCER
jgi:Ca2+-binding RTX toxin-like protein